jgi:imidazolonepropionase-like amidohydrolase
VRLHAEQLSNQRGAVLAAEYQALSVDHLEYLAKSDVGGTRGRGNRGGAIARRLLHPKTITTAASGGDARRRRRHVRRY